MSPLWFRGTITLDMDVFMRWQLLVFDPSRTSRVRTLCLFTSCLFWLAVLANTKAGRDLNPKDFQLFIDFLTITISTLLAKLAAR